MDWLGCKQMFEGNAAQFIKQLLNRWAKKYRAANSLLDDVDSAEESGNYLPVMSPSHYDTKGVKPTVKGCSSNMRGKKKKRFLTLKLYVNGTKTTLY